MLTEAIILAGGFGTRLQTVVSDVPKPMAPVNGNPFLNYILKYLKFYGVRKAVLSTGYLSEKILNYYGNNHLGLDLAYTKEESPLGTGGGIRLALEKCHSEKVLVLNGDSFFDVNISQYTNQHNTFKSQCSLALRKVNNASRYGTITLGENARINSFKEKDGKEVSGLINGGVYILNRELYLNETKSNVAFSIEKDFFETKVQELNICGFEHEGYFIDIGIPEDYQKAQNDFMNFKYQ